ncbi:hypothetical protein ACP70R_000509 [Stipagrostis hirtigluma subsp. patula]
MATAAGVGGGEAADRAREGWRCGGGGVEDHAAWAPLQQRQDTFLSDTSGKILHEDQFVKKFDLDRAMFDHEMDMSKRLHEQNMKIIKLQGEADAIESQTSTLYYVCAIVGVGLVAPVLFSH